MYPILRKQKIYIALLIALGFILTCQNSSQDWEPNTDWGHWRLGQKADPEFLIQNNMTITFGSGAPNFEYVSRAEFDQKMAEAKAFNQQYHNDGYIVLRYLSTSLNGNSESNSDIPVKDQIDLAQFYHERWHEFEDYLGPQPPKDPTTWLTIHPDGTFPFYRYAPYGQETDEGFETWGCPNNPHYVRMMEGRIRAQAETGIDGSYVDWTQIAGGTCYCDYCRKSFQQFLRNNLPPETAQIKYGTSDYASIQLPQKRGEAFWMEWIQFRCHSVAEFHKRLRTVARTYNPNFMIAGNVFGGFGYGPIAYDAAGNIELLGQSGYDDFIYSEMQEYLDSAPRKDEHGTKMTNSPALKFIAAAAHGKPAIIYATEITPPIFPNPTEQCLSAMAQINIAEAVANHAVFREKRQTPAGATAMYRFLADNEHDLLGAQLYSPVGIVASLKQYLADELSFAFSTSRVLADRGIAHVMMVEQDLLSGAINDRELILLPYLPLLSLQTQHALKTYVANGGKLLILGECGTKDEYNVPHNHVILTELLEVQNYPLQTMSREVRNGKVVFVPLPIPESRYLIPQEKKGAVTTFGPSMADVFPDIPEGYTRNRIDPQLRIILEGAASALIDLQHNNITQIVGDFPYVEITTMLDKQGTKLLVHYVNYDVTIDGVVTAAENIRTQIVLPKNKKAKSVRVNGTLSSMIDQSFEITENNDRQRIDFTVDRLDIYGLAVIEME